MYPLSELALWKSYTLEKAQYLAQWGIQIATWLHEMESEMTKS
jgi:hypothetical protein